VIKKQKAIVADLIKIEFSTWDKIEALKKAGIRADLLDSFTLIDIALDIAGFPENSKNFDRMNLYNIVIEIIIVL
jgi:hypothetical protein